MIVRGLDRLEGTRLAGMGDELWASHTLELRQRYDEQQQRLGPDARSFAAFCGPFAEAGGLTTMAMVNYEKQVWRPPRVRPSRGWKHEHGPSKRLAMYAAACMLPTLLDCLGTLGTCTAAGTKAASAPSAGAEASCGTLDTLASCLSEADAPVCLWADGWPWLYPALGLVANLAFANTGWLGPEDVFVAGHQRVGRLRLLAIFCGAVHLGAIAIWGFAFAFFSSFCQGFDGAEDSDAGERAHQQSPPQLDFQGGFLTS